MLPYVGTGYEVKEQYLVYIIPRSVSAQRTRTNKSVNKERAPARKFESDNFVSTAGNYVALHSMDSA